MNRILIGLLVIASVCLSGPKGNKGKPPSGPRADLTAVQSWGLQLQGADIGELVACDYDLVAIDYSKDGTDATAYSYAEIESVRNSGKVVLA